MQSSQSNLPTVLPDARSRIFIGHHDQLRTQMLSAMLLLTA
jgi:hypothetical protein